MEETSIAYETIKYQVTKQMLTSTLNRPERLKASTATIECELIDVFDGVDKDGNIRPLS
ncbi:hypothetical protein CI41S_21240 [Bradyrhizobium ivorense]|nr:hypothetical protein CI41S_21240 [Bradyrhizobium ivorense]